MAKPYIQSVKIHNPIGEGSFGTQCEINGEKVEGVVGVDFHVSVSEAPRFVFEINGMPDIEMNAEVQFRFTPKTVQEAVAVIRKEIVAKTISEDIVQQILGIQNPKIKNLGCITE